MKRAIAAGGARGVKVMRGKALMRAVKAAAATARTKTVDAGAATAAAEAAEPPANPDLVPVVLPTAYPVAGAADAAVAEEEADPDSDSDSDLDSDGKGDEAAADGGGEKRGAWAKKPGATKACRGRPRRGSLKGAPKLAPKDRLKLSIGSAVTTARVKRCSNSQGKVEVALDSVVACRMGDRIAVEVRRREGKGWSLAGFGVVRDGAECDLEAGAQAEGEPGRRTDMQSAAAPEPTVTAPSPTSAAEEKHLDRFTAKPDEPHHGRDHGCDQDDTLDFSEGGDQRWRQRFTALLEEKSRALLDHTRLKVPPPQLVRDGGARALWVNFGATCRVLRRPPSHLAAFIRAEGGLGAVSMAGLDDISEAGSGSCGDLLQLRLHTRARALMDKVCKLLRKYCHEFVSCKQCRSAQTTLTRNDDKDVRRRATADMILTCRECSACTFVRRI
mmetsp:Transcript_5953/g.10082  ORF Transcript_5953/g.10082 Transcript_5953/m.10082 type:complete len:444 (-) Transcript_5953:517-1848(-)